MGIEIAALGLIEGIAELANSLIKKVSSAVSLWATNGSAFAFSISAPTAAAVGLMLIFGPYAWLAKRKA